MAPLVGGRSGELDHADVSRVERGDEAFDRASLPGGIPAFEHGQDRRPELAIADLAAQRQAKLREPLPGAVEPSGLLLARQGLRQVQLVETPHARDPLTSGPTDGRCPGLRLVVSRGEATAPGPPACCSAG